MNKSYGPRYEFGPYHLDVAERLLLRAGQPVSLKPKCFDLLRVLIENRGHVLKKDELMQQVWPNQIVEESNLAVSIFVLRKMLGDGQDKYIETVPRYGYRFVADVTEKCAEDNDSGLKHGGHHKVDFPPALSANSLAVLPLKSMGSRRSRDNYLGLGMADALITRLSRLRQITVRPTSSIRRFTDAQDPVSVGTEIKVESVLDGNIRRSGERIRVTVQLLSVCDGTVLWAEKFDEKFTDIFSVEDSISEQVAEALSLKLSGKDRQLLRKRYTENPDAYVMYLKGIYFLEKRTREGFRKGIECFERAIAIDSNYALAYAGLADAYTMQSSFSMIDPNAAEGKAKEAALKALELDDTLAEAHTALAHIRMYFDWDWASAESEFKRAIACNRNHARAHNLYAVYLRTLGRFDEAWRQSQEAERLDPLSVQTHMIKGSLLYLSGQYDQAIEQFLRTLEMKPDHLPAHNYLGFSYEQKGMYEQAAAEFQTAITVSEGSAEDVCNLGHLYALMGKQAEAQKIIDELKSQSASPYFVAVVYAALGERKQALDWLDEGLEKRDPELGLLRVDPRWASFWSEPEFRELLVRIGLCGSNEKL